MNFRELVDALRVANIQPWDGSITVTGPAADDLFIALFFPSWVAYW